jgi:hypothetical protein
MGLPWPRNAAGMRWWDIVASAGALDRQRYTALRVAA